MKPLPLALAALFAAFSLGDAVQQGKAPPRTGRYRGDIVDPVKGDVIMKVAMNSPAKPPPLRHLALLLLFHGFNGNENNYIGYTVDALTRIGLLDSYVVISGKSKGPGWTVDDDEPVRRIIAWAKDTYPIDPRRVFFFGSSNGAAMVGRFGWAHQDLVAGIVAYCGGGYKFTDPPAPPDPAETRTEWYFVHGGNDKPENSRRACADLKAKGYRTVFRQLDGYGHTDIWDGNGHPDLSVVNDVRDDWLWWIQALRHKTVAPSAAEQKLLSSGDSKSRAEGLFQNRASCAELARIGGPQAAPLVAGALQSKSAGVRGAAAESCERTLFGKAAVEELAKLVRDDSDGVRQATLKSLAAAANWRYAEAQSALCALAADRAARASDRVLAVEGLGKAVKLALLGNFEDAKLFWTLVALLDDDEPRVRAASFAALAKAVSDGFGYKPDLPASARKDAAAKWAAWCAQKCGPEPK